MAKRVGLAEGTGFTKDTRCTVWVVPQDGFQCRVSRRMTQNEQCTKLFHVQRPEGTVVTYGHTVNLLPPLLPNRRNRGVVTDRWG